jgi:N-acetyl-gamma-glutamyl-phosphate reductase
MRRVIDEAAQSDVIFIALPHGHAMKVALELKNSKARIIDLGADYRFSDCKTYEQWYKIPHIHPISGAVYGLAEINKEKIKTAKIVANPGCYATASILALYPLLKAALIDSKSIIIDAASGVSGAGRTLKQGSHFAEVFENFSAYAVASHRHTPEIEEQLSLCAGQKITLNFTPHLLPAARGILATCYANVKDGVSERDIADAYEVYKGRRFIRLLGINGLPATKNARGSNYADIGWHIDKRTNRIIVLSAIDNLVKGASGQAVQNMNIMFGLNEETGLNDAPVYP